MDAPGKIPANGVLQRIEMIVHLDRVGFLPEMKGWSDICKPVNVTHHSNRMSAKNHAILPMGRNSI